MKNLLACLCLALAAPCVLAQNSTGSPASAQTPAPAPTPAGREPLSQRVERIRIDDDSNRIDEVRVGGATQAITVQPKSGMPAYEIIPSSGVRAPGMSRDDGQPQGGQRVWNLLKF